MQESLSMLKCPSLLTRLCHSWTEAGWQCTLMDHEAVSSDSSGCRLVPLPTVNPSTTH